MIEPDTYPGGFVGSDRVYGGYNRMAWTPPQSFVSRITFAGEFGGGFFGTESVTSGPGPLSQGGPGSLDLPDALVIRVPEPADPGRRNPRPIYGTHVLFRDRRTYHDAAGIVLPTGLEDGDGWEDPSVVFNDFNIRFTPGSNVGRFGTHVFAGALPRVLKWSPAAPAVIADDFDSVNRWNPDTENESSFGRVRSGQSSRATDADLPNDGPFVSPYAPYHQPPFSSLDFYLGRPDADDSEVELGRPRRRAILCGWHLEYRPPLAQAYRFNGVYSANDDEFVPDHYGTTRWSEDEDDPESGWRLWWGPDWLAYRPQSARPFTSVNGLSDLLVPETARQIVVYEAERTHGWGGEELCCFRDPKPVGPHGPLWPGDVEDPEEAGLPKAVFPVPMN